MTPIADMVARMMAAGVAPELIELAVATAERCTKNHSAEFQGNSAERVLSERRAADRARKKPQQNQHKTGKQTMSGDNANFHGNSTEKASIPCELSSLSEPPKEKVKKGTRLSKASCLAAEDYSFAAREGIPPTEIPKVWAEFVDYWISVPGSRGRKLDWDATWRNRVRQLTPWKGKANGTGHRTLATAGDDLIANTAESAEQDGDRAFDLTP